MLPLDLALWRLAMRKALPLARATSSSVALSVLLLGALSLGGCVSGRGAIGGGEPPEPSRAEPVVEPELPDLSLEERWEAPFAVLSSGRPAVRRERQMAKREPAISRTAPSASAGAADEPTSLRTHQVQWGDTWFGIARMYAVSRSALAAANPGVEPERLRAGDLLQIPEPGGVEPVRTHTVVAGDSLWGISRRYGVEMDAIRSANGLDGDRVRIGQTLIIPIR